MMRLMFIILALFGGAYGQAIVMGSCPDVNVVKNFNASAYLGNWYENERYPMIFEIATKCNSATYSLNSNGSVHVLNIAVSSLTGISQLIEGTATLVGDGTEGRLEVVFPTRPGAASPYLIVGTDYTNWAGVYACMDLGNLISARFAWLLTRESHPSEEVVTAAKAAFGAQNIAVDLFHVVDHGNSCPPLPAL